MIINFTKKKMFCIHLNLTIALQVILGADFAEQDTHPNFLIQNLE